MFELATELERCTLITGDGESADVVAFLFDDREWHIDYLIVDTGEWLTGRSVLLSTETVGTPDVSENVIRTDLRKSRIEDAPSIDLSKPISERELADLHRYYEWSTFRPGILPDAPTTVPGTAMPDSVTTEYAITDESRGEEHRAPPPERHLRNTSEVHGYSIQLEDEMLGRVADFLVDAAEWNIRYLIADVGNWKKGTEYVVPIMWIESVDYLEQKISVGVERTQFEEAPKFDRGGKFTREEELRFYEHFDLPAYW
jgi:hypothetical protein